MKHSIIGSGNKVLVCACRLYCSVVEHKICLSRHAKTVCHLNNDGAVLLRALYSYARF